MTCKDCIHYEACKAFNRMRQNVIDTSSSGAEKLCGRFADKSRFIELPCKIGDEVYLISSLHGNKIILPRQVDGLGYYGDKSDLKWSVTTTEDWNEYWLGEDIFLTREEAEAEEA